MPCPNKNEPECSETELVPSAEQTPATIWLEKPAHHHYSYGVIELFVNLVLHAPTSFRGASGALDIFAPYSPVGDVRMPSANCGTYWLLRLGLYELSRPLEIADDWIWLVDHTVQIGAIRCLLIVGIRLSVWQQLDRPLTHQDLSVVALEPTELSTAEQVRAEYEKGAQRTGTPRAILSDAARNLQRATDDFRSQNAETSPLSDAKHKVALLLKRELEDDSRWQEFVRQAASSRSQLTHDPLAYLSPPTLKHKARFMNLEELVAWGTKTRRFLDAPTPYPGQELNLGKLNLTLGWLRQYDESLSAWDSLLRTAAVALDALRVRGYHAEAAAELREAFLPVATSEVAQRVADDLVEFVSAQSQQARPGERLPASTEVLESLIGKGKRLEGQQSQGGFTQSVLAMAAAVTRPTQELIEQAFAAVKTKDVLHWVRTKLGVSLNAQRQAALPPPTNGTKPDPTLSYQN